MEVFKDYAYYYNLIYGNKNYEQEAKEVKQLLQEYGKIKEGAKLLNIGCGTGRHDNELSKLGFQMHGIDLSDNMIAIAKKTNPNITFEVGDARNWKTEKQFDGVISLFHVMSYQNSNKDLQCAFTTARKALKKDGVFLFDAWYGPGVLSDKPAVRIKELEDSENYIIRMANPIMHSNENIVDVCYKVLITNKKTNVTKKIDEIHNMRYFFKPEIEKMLELCGFQLINVMDCSNLKEPTFDSWTTYFVAKAI